MQIDNTEVPFEANCDLIERELKKALEDIQHIRANKKTAKTRFPLLKAALGSVRHYSRELERSLEG